MQQSTFKEIVIWGASGHAKVLLECLRLSTHKVVAFIDNNPQAPSLLPGIPIVHGKKAFEAWLEKRSVHGQLGFLVAIGGDKGAARIETHEYLESQSLAPITAIHASAFVAHNSKIGPGSHILAHASVCVEAELGRNCIVNTSASIDHECHLGDGVHVAPGATLTGCVRVERFAMIGAGATVLPRLTIGEGAVVGAGAVVVKNVEANTVVAGNPARKLQRSAGTS